MATAIPTLPPFLIQPLSCPPSRCNHPGKPLPPFSPNVDKLHSRMLSMSIQNQIWEYANTERDDMTQAINTTVLAWSNAGPVNSISLASAEAVQWSRELVERLIIGHLKLETLGMSGRIATFFRDGMSTFIDEMISGADNASTLCLHDMLESSEDVYERVQARLDAVEAAGRSTSIPDPRPLLDLASMAITRGMSSEEQSRDPELWEARLLAAQYATVQGIRRMIFQRLGMEYVAEGYQAVVDRSSASAGHRLLLPRRSLVDYNPRLHYRIAANSSTRPILSLAHYYPRRHSIRYARLHFNGLNSTPSQPQRISQVLHAFL